MPFRLDWQGLAQPRGNPDVEIPGVGCNALDRSSPAPEIAAHDAHAGAVVIDDLGNLRGPNVLVARLGHLERGGQVGPELEAVHAAMCVAFRHFLVEDAAASCHPLHVASAKRTLVAKAVLVFHRAGKHIGDRLDAAMWVPGKSSTVVVRTIIAKIIQQQEGIKGSSIVKTKRAAQFYPGAFDGGLGLGDAFYRTYGHD